VLGGTRGYLLVDGFTGYNAVTVPKGRTRVGCWAHVRRRFFEAQATAPEAKEMLAFILDLYRVEQTQMTPAFSAPRSICGGAGN